MAPRLIELCFQTAGLWDLGTKGRLSLPYHIDRVATFEPVGPSDIPLFAIVRPDGDRRSFDADVVDADNRVYLCLRGYRTVEVPGGFDQTSLEPLTAAMAPDGDRHPLGVAVAVDTKQGQWGQVVKKAAIKDLTPRRLASAGRRRLYH
jgi:hypothetical protein